MNEIKTSLETLPEEIYKAASEMNQKRLEIDKAKLNLDIASAHSLLRAEGTVAQKEATATIETEKYQKELLLANYNYHEAEIEVNRLKDQFDAQRKIASLQISENEILKIGG